MHDVNDVPDTLPSSRTLLRSTLMALAVAGAVLVGFVLPAEYGVDPVGIGRLFGLTEGGRIKLALARAAEETTAVEASDATDSTAATNAATSAAVSGQTWRDSMTVTLAPGKGIELKLAMRKGQKATYQWRATSPDVTYNAHGEPPNAAKGFAHSYGRGLSDGEQGDLVAAFDGVHGWFWRNRSAGPVSITLQTRGEYQTLKQIK